MKQKSFKVKKGIIIDIAFYLVLIVFCALVLFFNEFESIKSIFGKLDTFGKFNIIVIEIILAILKCLPIILIYYCIRKAYRKQKIKNSKFNVVNDIKYYRDILTDVSPATISLISDMGIENEKDVKAMLLYYELKKVITMDAAGNIISVDWNNKILKNSDVILLNTIINKTNDLKPWKEEVIKEAEISGYITPVSRKRNLNIKTRILIGLVKIVSVMVVLYLLSSRGVFSINELEKQYGTDFELLEQYSVEEQNILILSNSSVIEVIYIGLLLIIVLTICSWSPLIKFIKLITKIKLSKENKFARTNLGDKLAEKVYGLKNYINDFSQMKERDKEYLAIWEEYLIYSVVLGDNTTAIKN